MNKILIIEDDFEVVDNLSEILSLQGYSVEAASNGKSGLEKALEMLPDLIICDISMPEMDGYQVLSLLRSNPLAFSIPLIFLTAKIEKSDQRLGMELGADDYITKPFSHKEIIQSVKTQLEKQNKSRQYHENNLEELRYNIASTIPHEMRTPLNTILGFVQIMQDGYQGFEKSEIDMMLGNIFNAGKRLLRLIVNYSFYTKLSVGNIIDLTYSDTEILATKEIITSVVKDIAENYGSKVVLKLDLVDFSCNFSFDSFSKIVEELTDNAIKFANKGSQVNIISNVSGNFLVLKFENYGRIMTQDQINKIGAFSQFDRKMYEQQGSGLGLAIVKKLVDIFKGKLEIYSSYADKTVVTVTIPIKQK